MPGWNRYAQFVEAVEAGSRDNLEFIKSKAIKALGVLLAAKPEQEGRLLAALANKLGDPSRKLASKACSCGAWCGCLSWVLVEGNKLSASWHDAAEPPIIAPCVGDMLRGEGGFKELPWQLSWLARWVLLCLVLSDSGLTAGITDLARS